MTTFFTSDTHYGHKNILKMANRPFETIEQMNEVLIRNWNALVQPRDTIYHLGDFSFLKWESAVNTLNQLNGHIIFITGNHDKEVYRFKDKFMEFHQSYLERKIEGINFTLCHYALRVWNKSHHGAYHLYGHSHGTLADDPHSLSFDCGVDCFNYSPIPIDRVVYIMSHKDWHPIDHHGEE